MALTDKLTSITNKYVMPTLEDNVYDSNAFFQRLKASGRYKSQDGGIYVTQPVLYQANNQGLWYTGDDGLNTTMPAMNTDVTYYWTHYDIPIVVTFTDTIKNSGPSAVLSLVAVAMQGTEASMADDIGTALFNAGTNSKAMGGLRLAVSTSNTVGTVSQSTYSWWQAKVDSTTTLLSLHAIRNRISQCTIGKTRPTLLIGDRDMFDRVVDLLEPAQRLMDPKVANSGFETVNVAGVPFVIDSHCPASYLFVITESVILWFYSPRDNFRLLPFQMQSGQRVMTARLGLSGNLVYKNNRLLGALSAITG